MRILHNLKQLGSIQESLVQFSKLYKQKFTKEAIESDPKIEEEAKTSVSEYGNEIVSIEVDKFILTPGMQ